MLKSANVPFVIEHVYVSRRPGVGVISLSLSSAVCAWPLALSRYSRASLSLVDSAALRSLLLSRCLRNRFPRSSSVSTALQIIAVSCLLSCR